MRVVQINKLYFPVLGGVETHVKDVAEALSQDSLYNVSVLCCNESKEDIEEVINGVPVIKAATMRHAFSMPISWSFIKKMRTLSADLLHFHLPNPLSVVAYLLTRPQGKVVVTWHSDITRQKLSLLFYRPFLRAFLKKADCIITTSQNLAEKSSFLPAYSNKVHSVPLGLKVDAYKQTQSIQTLKKKIQEKHGPFVLFVGRFVYYKGVMTLLAALNNTPIKVVCIGTGPLKDKMNTYIVEHNLQDNLDILGPQDHETLQAYFAACQYFVLPSTHKSEAFGIVQLEAMIQEKAVISTQLPTGVPYVNQHNQTGLIVEPGNTQDLRAALLTLWEDSKKCEVFGKAAKARVLSHFQQETMIARIQSIYHTVLKAES